MRFEVLPVIDLMLGLYHQPAGMERFHQYLKHLQGNTRGDLAIPLGGFNPMGKAHVAEKLEQLKALHAEDIMADTLSSLGPLASGGVFKVALNLCDDLKGGWTHRYTTDYDARFKIQALVARGFCVPVFWTSESYDAALIRSRTLESCYRTLYWLTASKPLTLEDHGKQERYVAIQAGSIPFFSDAAIAAFYQQHKDSREYAVIFNFLYGDEAAASLGFPTFGIPGAMTGLRYLQQLT
ncbi:hypothetical protein HHL17_16765 [Chitinophaga sp. G-6-1-13]|uniref:Uncharacterized protein n=1 Tax=Chitinophaga fulva TaxID=2728842 RepID=A0A848GMM5_9BACT|nr:hypothetical protein [Chitinophaga fulva]NML38861.1 hypothetical protein [Chitinophaga fulva]